MAGKFEVSKRSNGDFQFNLKAGNGQVILSSQGYSGEDACLGGIESVRKNAGTDANFERLDAKDGSKYFTLKAGNGQVIGSSQMYADAGGRDNGIRSVMDNAPGAVVDDTTA
ncbi:MAG: hypothetical protein CL625_02875 [Arenimonas sp.]|nr:hypothetical protein [Arenimonas sp.]